MRIRFTLFLLVILACACEAQETSTTIIPVDILFPDTFHFEFGYFGDEEGIVLEQAPLFAQYYELSELQWESRTFHYQPQDPFAPSDTAMLIEFRGSDGGGPSMLIDTTIFVFNPLIDYVREDKTKKIDFWPNPSSGTVLNTSENAIEYLLYNSSGLIVQKGRTSENGQISMVQCGVGLYYLRLGGQTIKFIRI